MKIIWMTLTVVCVFAISETVSAQDLLVKVRTSVEQSESLESLKSRLVKELAFHFAETNHVAHLKKLCDELGIGRDLRDESENSLLHLAVKSGALDTSKWLIESGMDVEVTNKHGFTPMCFAAESGHGRLVRTLFESGANLNGTTTRGIPQVLAAASGHEATLKLLLELGADPDLADTKGNTPLHFAVKQGSANNVRCLVDHAADVLAVNTQSQTPLSIAKALYKNAGAEKEGKRDWGTEQVIGPPNSTNGDCRLAWASKSQDGQEEWLIVEFDEPVVPQAFEIYENLGPNAVNRITWLDIDGGEHEVWSGEDPAVANETGVHVAKIEVDMDERANRFKIYIDSVNVPQWNEIDAIGLLSDGKKQWVAWAEASSCYAGGTYRGSNYRSISKLMERRAATLNAEPRTIIKETTIE